MPAFSLTLSFDFVHQWNISCCHVFIILKSIHLSLLCSPPLPPSLGHSGGSAWMSCWVHGNWVVIDWTAAWPVRVQWELEDRSSSTDYICHPTFCWRTYMKCCYSCFDFIQHVHVIAKNNFLMHWWSFDGLGLWSGGGCLSYFTVMSPLEAQLSSCCGKKKSW